MKTITDYINTPSVRVFQTFAGESLNRLDQYEAWDIITILSQAVSSAHLNSLLWLDIPNTIRALADKFEISDRCHKCLTALDGFPVEQVNALMIGILKVAFEEG